MDVSDKSTMYRLASALNHKGNRDKNNYKGPDTFLTNVNGELRVEKENKDPGQLWHFTGEGRLLNGKGKYLTACDGKSLEFRPWYADPL